MPKYKTIPCEVDAYHFMDAERILTHSEDLPAWLLPLVDEGNRGTGGLMLSRDDDGQATAYLVGGGENVELIPGDFLVKFKDNAKVYVTHPEFFEEVFGPLNDTNTN